VELLLERRPPLEPLAGIEQPDQGALSRRLRTCFRARQEDAEGDQGSDDPGENARGVL